jgi:hypothetical protein
MAMLALAVVLFLMGILPFEQTRNLAVREHTTGLDASEALAHARETEGQLRVKLDDLLAAAAERKKQCTTSPSEAHTATTQSSSAATTEDYRQFDERLAKAGAVSGEISVSLLWDNKNDLDLIIVCPSGKLLYYNNPSECGGTLDIDKNASDLTDRPVENVYWPQDQAPAGTYRVAVKYYARKDFSLPAQSAFQVRLVEQGKLSLFKGTVGPEEMRPVTVFTVRP